MELYLDKFIDLLDPANSPSKKKKKLPYEKSNSKIEIHEDSKTRNIYLTGSDTLNTVVTARNQAMELIKKGCSFRTTSATQMNEYSSRSHSILTIHIESRENRPNAPVHIGKLNLVDLAGSERLAKSGWMNI